ncbi:MAG: sn-glycerol-1-phosphate dehydrogenase [Rhizobiales bacterium]|nr:sn-glycerol-1-phosphate dehydrogenase [Hyphomicrobiales bacterium]
MVEAKTVHNGAPVDWNSLIRDVTNGTWKNPDTDSAVSVPFRHIDINNNMAENANTLLNTHMPSEKYGIVCDAATADIMGLKIAKSLGSKAELIVLDHPHADEMQIDNLRKVTANCTSLVAVGSGTINDLCKYATHLDGRPYSVFGTAPSMNGYTSSTASITLKSGLKTTKEAHAAKGVFIDIGVSAEAPQYLIGAGLGDSLCRPTAHVDWYFSHMMLGTSYATAPYLLQEDDEAELLLRTEDLGRRDYNAIGYLQRVLTLGGLGIAVVGTSHPGSMGEHQISHWIDSFAGNCHPGTVHGQQVGVASVTMARLQELILSQSEAPRIRAYQPDEAAIRARYPAAAVENCLKVSRSKIMSQAELDTFNTKLEEIWPTFRKKLKAMMIPADEMAAHLRVAKGGATYDEIGLDRDLYVEAVLHCREMRDRYSMLDLADDMGILNDFIEESI